MNSRVRDVLHYAACWQDVLKSQAERWKSEPRGWVTGFSYAQPSHKALERLWGLPQDTPIYPRVDAELAGPVDMDPVRPEHLCGI